ncbi:MAG: indole-3-glycerol phosphate synthase TrpC [Phototrophicales bacterium]|nr:MAG: indole-3-glycerol phosphate synthase TrpC [Phototrophicales bacterium]
MSQYVKTDTILDRILENKAAEIARLREEMRDEPWLRADLIDSAGNAPPPLDFASALRRGEQVALIAEIKKASPSKGVLIEDFDPEALAETYAENGAAAISVLTDERFFQGSLDHLEIVRETVDLPLLRKDFIIDPLQVYQARAAGADATLLIVMALTDAQLVNLHGLITGLGMAALVEVHDETELTRALDAGAALIGVNNRNLRTFHEDLETMARVARRLPSDVTLVAESAIRTPEDVRRMGELGAHAVLVGEGLVKAGDIGAQVRQFSSQARGKR